MPDELGGSNITQDTARLAVQPEMDRVYVVEFLNTFWAQAWMKRHTLGQVVQGLNLADLRNLPIPIPPLPVQKEFAEKAMKVRALEEQQGETRGQIEALFKSALHHAFSG